MKGKHPQDTWTINRFGCWPAGNLGGRRFPPTGWRAGRERKAMPARGVVFTLFALMLLLAPGSTAQTEAAGRVALVVGNSDYAYVGRLPNPGNDATDVSAALRRLGFEVTTVRNAGRAALTRALADFTDRSIGADIALVFYAGHGIEMDGVNYLVPVDARLERDTRVRFETVTLDDVLVSTEGAALRLVILDACRNNPLARSMRRTVRTRSVSNGSFGDLDETWLEGGETLVAYAAAAKTTADDGTGRNSPFTAALLAHLEQPLELLTLFRRVRAEVLSSTEGRQRPHEYQSLLGLHYLAAPAAPLAGAPTVASAAAGSSSAILAMQQETVFWESIRSSANPADFAAYLTQWPSGVFAPLARNRQAELRARPAAPTGDGAAVAPPSSPIPPVVAPAATAPTPVPPPAVSFAAPAGSAPDPPDPGWRPVPTADERVEGGSLCFQVGPASVQCVPAADGRVSDGRPGGRVVRRQFGGDATFALLLRRPPSASYRDENDWTDLHHLAVLNLPHLVSALVGAGGDVNARLRDDGKAISGELRRTLRKRGQHFGTWTRNGETPLHLAALVGARETAIALLAAGADLRSRTPLNWTPLHYGVVADARGVVRLLLARGANVEARVVGDWTPLHLAVWAEAEGAAAELLAHGADLGARTSDGETPWDLAPTRRLRALLSP